MRIQIFSPKSRRPPAGRRRQRSGKRKSPRLLSGVVPAGLFPFLPLAAGPDIIREDHVIHIFVSGGEIPCHSTSLLFHLFCKQHSISCTNPQGDTGKFHKQFTFFCAARRNRFFFLCWCSFPHPLVETGGITENPWDSPHFFLAICTFFLSPLESY